MKFMNDGKTYNAMQRFIEQIEEKEVTTEYDSGVVNEIDGNYVIGYAMRGAEDRAFSVGQPVYDKDGNLMGYLGVGLFNHLNYSADIRIPCEYWQICLPTKYCKAGKRVYTYWQNKERQKT